MTDKVDDQSDEFESEDLSTEEFSPEESFDDDALEEEFDFDSDELELPEEEQSVEALEDDALEEVTPPTKPVKKKSGGSTKAIAAAMVLAIVGIIGYKGYDMMFKAKETTTAKQKSAPKAKKTETAKKSQKETLPSFSDIEKNTPPPKDVSSLGDSLNKPKPADIQPTPPPSIPKVDDIANNLPNSQNADDNWFANNNNAANAANTAPAIPNYEPEVKKEDLTSLENKLTRDNKRQSDRLDSIESDMGKLMQRMSDINHNISSMQKAISQMSANMNQYSDQVEQIQKVQEKKQQQVQAQKNKQVEKQKVQQKSAPTMSIHAIIPGRAWLRSDDGQIISVTEGDTIGSYGKVLRIDANEGAVVTSSGVTLR